MQESKKGFNPQESIVPGIALLFGIAYFVQTTDAPWIAIKWPYALAGLTAVFWLAVVGVYVFSRPAGPTDQKTSPAEKLATKKKPLIILIAPVIYIFSMQYIGFALSSLIFLSLLFRALDGRSWWRNILIAFGITAFLYVAMILLMQMALPRLEIGSFIL